MALKRLLTSVAIGVAMLSCIARATLAQNATPPAPAQAPPAATGIAALRDVLRNPDLDLPQAERDEAARRLLVLDSPEATKALLDTVVDVANLRGQQAVARAVSEDSTPDPAFIIPLRSIIGPDATASDVAARALANYRGDGNARLFLLEAASDPNRRLPPASRAAVIRSLAPVADKRTAQELVNIVTNDAEPLAIRNVAADELVEMTGFTAAARDPERWKQWWVENGRKPDAQLDAELLAARVARLDRMEPKYERLVAEMRALLASAFQAAPAAKKEEELLKYLRSPEGEVRLLGASLIVDLFTENKPIPESARQELRKMVGDSDRNVRLAVAGALHDINDIDALDAVLGQLAAERDPAVRAALAEALAPMGNARAVAPLIALLKDESATVVQSAAAALQGLRAQLREVDAKLTRDVSMALNDALQRTGASGNRVLREQIVAAMAAWAHAGPEVRDTFMKLLNRPNESPGVRQRALEYFGKMGSDATWPADSIIQSGALEDRAESVRLAAVEALGKVAQADHAQSLYDRMRLGELPMAEPEPAVREAAWKALTAMFPSAFNVAQLNVAADRFQQDPQRRLTILKVLRQKLADQRSPDELAVVQQNIGDAHMRLGEYREAAVEFKALLDSPARRGQQNDQLVKQLLDAYLGARDYEQATRFAAEQIAANRAYQTILGPTITNEAERLKDPESALRLVTLALKMDPPLDATFAERLRKVQRGLEGKAPAPPATEPSG